MLENEVVWIVISLALRVILDVIKIVGIKL